MDNAKIVEALEQVWQARLYGVYAQLAVEPERQALIALTLPDEEIAMGDFRLRVQHLKAPKSIPIVKLVKRFPDTDWAQIADTPHREPRIYIRRDGLSANEWVKKNSRRVR